MSAHKSLVGHFSADGTGRDIYLTDNSKAEYFQSKKNVLKMHLKNSMLKEAQQRFPLVFVPEKSMGDFHISKAGSFFENSKNILRFQKQHDKERARERNSDILRKEIDWNERCFHAMRSKSPQPLPLLFRKVVLHRTKARV